MWLVYRCDTFTAKDIQNLANVDVIKAGNFEQRAIHAYCKNEGVMSQKTTNKNPTVRVAHLDGDLSIAETVEFTAIMHDQTFNTLLKLTDEQVTQLTAKYKELYKVRMKEVLTKLEKATIEAIDNDDPTFIVEIKPNMNTVMITASQLGSNSDLAGVANLADQVRKDLAEQTEVRIEVSFKE
mgnify:FL=1